MAMRELALHLIEAGTMPSDPADLKTLIAPLVCGDPVQQQEFYDRFAEWIAGRAPVPEEVSVLPKRGGGWIRIAAGAVLLVGGMIGGGLYLKSLFRPIPALSLPAPPRPVVEPGTEVSPPPHDEVRGMVETVDGYAAETATVWIPSGIDTPQYPKAVTDSRGGFAIVLAAARKGEQRVSVTLRSSRQIFNHGLIVNRVVFSPDGSKLVIDAFGGAEVLDAATGKVLLEVGGVADTSFAAAISPNGRRVAAGGAGDIATVWDAVTGKKLLTLGGHSDSVEDIAFSPDGRKLATASADTTAKVWDLATGKELFTLRGHGSRLDAVAFSPNGRTLATGSYDGTARIWDSATGKRIFTLNQGNSVLAVAFSPDGRRLATGGYGGVARIWDTVTGKALVSAGGHTGQVNRVVFSPDGRTLATASNDDTAGILNSFTGKELLVLRGHRDRVNSADFSPDGGTLATSSNDFSVRLWHLVTTSTSTTNAALSLLVTHPDYEPGYVEQALAGSFRVIKLGPLKAAQRVLKFASIAVAPMRRFPRWVTFLLSLIPLSFAGSAFWRQRKRDRERKAFLDQWETHLDFEPVRVHSRSEEDELFQGADVATVARELRQRRPEPTSQLDIEPTVRLTAARAGLFTPVHLERRAAREYLVLLESKGSRDQQARFWNCFLDRLVTRDVWLERYSFAGDPRICEMPTTERGWLRIEEISALHPRHELWIVAHARSFFDFQTSAPAPWVPALTRWPERAVLNLAASTASEREQLSDLGFAVASAGVAGVAELNSEVVQPRGGGTSAPYPRVLAENEARWIHGPAPSGEEDLRELRSLDRQLRAWLGGNGYLLLMACAVYPGLAWNLTLHLALALLPPMERENALARLVRLAWFRHGRMPPWLRAYLTGKLSVEESSRVMGLLRDFLQRKELAGGGATASLEFAKREIASELRVQDKPPTRDYVFLSFLLGRKPQLRDLEAPAWLRYLLYPEGLPVMRLRRELWLVLGVLVGVLLYFGLESMAYSKPKPRPPEWLEVKPPRDLAAEPVNRLSARALEVAAAHLGQEVDEKFADTFFDKAVPFAVARGAARTGSLRPGVVFRSGAAGRSPLLVERIVEGGVITLEPHEGRLRRVFHATDEMTGSFVEITEKDTRKSGHNF